MRLVSLPRGGAEPYAILWRPLLERGAKEQGAERLPEYLVQIDHGVMWLHLVMTDDLNEATAVVGTRTYERDGVQVGEIAVCAGSDLAEWIGLLPELEDTLRREVRAERIVLHDARPGWRRVLQPYGYRTIRCDFERTL